jgi:hypothetical protein
MRQKNANFKFTKKKILKSFFFLREIEILARILHALQA